MGVFSRFDLLYGQKKRKHVHNNKWNQLSENKFCIFFLFTVFFPKISFVKFTTRCSWASTISRLCHYMRIK